MSAIQPVNSRITPWSPSARTDTMHKVIKTRKLTLSPSYYRARPRATRPPSSPSNTEMQSRHPGYQHHPRLPDRPSSPPYRVQRPPPSRQGKRQAASLDLDFVRGVPTNDSGDISRPVDRRLAPLHPGCVMMRVGVRKEWRRGHKEGGGMVLI